jgi:mannose-6-phosphate isomerase-like protein (cupin superfamily)
MAVIRPTEQPLTLENRPEWCQIPRAGFFQMSKEGGEHDRHYHDSNELYLICRGRAKILNAGTEYYVKAGDIVCIKAGDEHDILELYSDENFELFWLYEPAADVERFGHLHRTPESAQPHPVPAKPLPPDFPD